MLVFLHGLLRGLLAATLLVAAGQAERSTDGPELERARRDLQDASRPLDERRSAARKLFAAGELDFLAARLRGEEAASFAFVLDVAAEDSLPGLLPAALPRLGGSGAELEEKARTYVRRMALTRRPEFIAALGAVLADEAASPASLKGAAAAVEFAPSTALIPPLIACLARTPPATIPPDAPNGSSDVASVLARALESLTGVMLGTDAAGWNEWWLAHSAKDRETLLAEGNGTLRGEVTALRRRVVELETARLAQATIEQCQPPLADPLPEVRVAALIRLAELAAVAARDSDARLTAFEPVREVAATRLRAWAQAAEAGQRVAVSTAEARATALLVAELSPANGELRALLVALEQHWIEKANRGAFIPALRRLARDRPDPEVACELLALLEAGPRGELLAELLAALHFVGDDRCVMGAEGRPSPLLRRCSVKDEDEPAVRDAALGAVADVARRGGDPALHRQAVELLTKALRDDPEPAPRLTAALGLGQMIDAIAAQRRTAPGAVALDAENLSLVFSALRETIAANDLDRSVLEPCCRALARIPGKEEEATAVLGELLATRPAPRTREVLLRALKELARASGLPAIAAELPPGGPAAEADATGKEAYAALLSVLKRANAEDHGVEVELAACRACASADRHEWAVHLAGQLLERTDSPALDERRAEVVLVFAESAAFVTAPAAQERAWRALSGLIAKEPAASEFKPRATLVLISLAEAMRPRFARETATAGADLLSSNGNGNGGGGGIIQDSRRDLARRVAGLYFVSGDWAASYALLDREFAEQEAPDEVLCVKARAAARRDDAEAVRDALRLHELLVGARAAGGRLARDAADSPAIVLELARIYLDCARKDDARATLAALPATGLLPADLEAERRLILVRLSGAP